MFTVILLITLVGAGVLSGASALVIARSSDPTMIRLRKYLDLRYRAARRASKREAEILLAHDQSQRVLEANRRHSQQELREKKNEHTREHNKWDLEFHGILQKEIEAARTAQLKLEEERQQAERALHKSRKTRTTARDTPIRTEPTHKSGLYGHLSKGQEILLSGWTIHENKSWFITENQKGFIPVENFTDCSIEHLEYFEYAYQEPATIRRYSGEVVAVYGGNNQLIPPKTPSPSPYYATFDTSVIEAGSITADKIFHTNSALSGFFGTLNNPNY